MFSWFLLPFCLFLSLRHKILAWFAAESVDTTNIRSNSNNKNILIAQISNLSEPNKAPYVKHLSLSPSDHQFKDYSALELLPTAAESFLPWRRDKSYQSLSNVWIKHFLAFFIVFCNISNIFWAPSYIFPVSNKFLLYGVEFKHAKSFRSEIDPSSSLSHLPHCVITCLCQT